MFFSWQLSNRPKNISWTHFGSSYIRFLESHIGKRNTIKLVSTNESASDSFLEQSLRVNYDSFSIDFLLNRFSNDGVLVFFGQSLEKPENEYNKQFAMLSMAANDSLLEDFRLFQSDLVDNHRLKLVEDICSKPSRFAPIVMEKSGRYRHLEINKEDVSIASRNWIKKVSNFLEDPFKGDPSLPFPGAWGSCSVDLSLVADMPKKVHKFTLSDTRYFNLSELDEFEIFIKEHVFQHYDNENPRVSLITNSALIDFIFYDIFKSFLNIDDYKRQHVKKWMCGYNPFIVTMNELSELSDTTVFIDMTKLPLIEVVRFGE